MQKNSKPADLAKYLYNSLKDNRSTYLTPTLDVLNELIECMYYASMQREEGQLIQVTVTFYDPNEPPQFPEKESPLDRWTFTEFEEPIDLDIKSLVKLSKAADPWSSSLAVYFAKDHDLHIYGMIDQAIHNQSFVNHEIDTRPLQPGYFQIAIQGIGHLSVTTGYKLIAVLRQNILVTQFLDVWQYGPISDLLKAKAESFRNNVNLFIEKNFPDEDVDDWDTLINNAWRDTISRILIQIKNYHHGGALLITGEVEGLDIKYPLIYKRLRGAMLRFIKYSIASEITANEISSKKTPITKSLYDKMEIYRSKKIAANNELKGSIRFIASHSCVDGLIVLNNELHSYGFGAIIDDIHPPPKIYISPTANIREATQVERDPKDFGTRHQSMMSFCWKNSEVIGIVISQDSEIRVITKCDKRLIMWENVKTQKYIKSKAHLYHQLSKLDDI